jgi:hypothetical protein
MKGTVVSYLAHIPPVKGEAYDPAPFDFRIHEVENVKDRDGIREQVLRDRGEIPAECYVDWYL